MTYPNTNFQTQTYTAATRPVATAVMPDTLINISDYGINGSLWRSNGLVWIPVSHSIKLQGLETGIILPSLVAGNLATYSQVGTTITVNNTVAHNIPATILDGDSVYLTASSGTLVEGVYTNFTRTGANTFTCVSAISQTISGFLASTTAIKTLATLIIPGGILGTTGRFAAQITLDYLNSANNKTATLTFGGTTFFSATLTTTTSNSFLSGMRNKNSASIQQLVGATGTTTGISSSSSALTTSAINTAIDANLALRATVAAASEYMRIAGCELSVWPSTIA